MSLSEILIFSTLIGLVAALYSSVGHGGASGYLAVLSFLVLDTAMMSTTALILNVLVAGIGLLQFSRAGFFSWKLSWPFILFSIPFAFVGGVIKVPDTIYFLVLAAVLLFAAYRLIFGAGGLIEGASMAPSRSVAVVSGAGIGLLSGVVGVGGGIFLSPVMILLKWATTKQTAAISAFFIVVNSLAGLGGRMARGGFESGVAWPFVFAAAAGGLAGSAWGAKKSTPRALRQLLGVVLLIAAIKLVMNAIT